MTDDPDDTERPEAYANTLAGQTETLRAWMAECFDLAMEALRIPKLVKWVGRKIDRQRGWRCNETEVGT